MKELGQLYLAIEQLGGTNGWNYHSSFIGAPHVEIELYNAEAVKAKTQSKKDLYVIKVAVTYDETRRKMNIPEAVQFLKQYIEAVS